MINLEINFTRMDRWLISFVLIKVFGWWFIAPVAIAALCGYLELKVLRWWLKQ